MIRCNVLIFFANRLASSSEKLAPPLSPEINNLSPQHPIFQLDYDFGRAETSNQQAPQRLFELNISPEPF